MNQHRAVGFTVAVATAIALLVLIFGLVIDELRGYPGWSRLAGLSLEAPRFGGLGASQVGYKPSMLKQFSSP